VSAVTKKELWKDESSRRVLAEKRATPMGWQYRMEATSANQQLAIGLWKRGSIAAMRSLITELNGNTRSLTLQNSISRLTVMKGLLDIVLDSVRRKGIEEALEG